MMMPFPSPSRRGAVAGALAAFLFSGLAGAATPKAAPPAQAGAPSWTVDAAKSQIAFEGQQYGQAFKGVFQRWSADIKFDPANLAGSSAKVTIETGSARTGDGTKDDTMKQGEWFDTSHFPTAVFQTTSITPLAAGKYSAVGTLTIKNKTYPLALPFTLAIRGKNATMQAALPLDRIGLGLGLTSDPKGVQIGRNVQLRIQVKATRQP
jgi:cytochrome b561